MQLHKYFEGSGDECCGSSDIYRHTAGKIKERAGKWSGWQGRSADSSGCGRSTTDPGCLTAAH